jgi:hypothetical protein
LCFLSWLFSVLFCVRVRRAPEEVWSYPNDLETTLAQVREAGGRILREPFGFPGGRRFHFEDPSGNELAAWSDK